jgi:hypothetical protein
MNICVRDMKLLRDRLVLKTNTGMRTNNSGLSQTDEIYLQSTYYQQQSAICNYMVILVITMQGILKG